MAVQRSERSDVGSMLEALREGSIAYAAKPAAIDEHVRLTYAEAYRSALCLASRLKALGVRRGDNVVLCVSNASGFIVLLAACEALGAIAALTAPTIAAQEMRRRLNLIKPAAVIVDELNSFGSALDGCGATVLSSSEALAATSGACGAFDESAVAADGCDSGGIIVFTSGSTGLPKAVVCRSAALFRNARLMNDSYGAVPGDVLFDPLPFSHVFGLLGACASVVAHATLATLGRYAPDDASSMAFSCQATIVYGVPTMMRRQLRVPGERDSMCGLRAFVVGGDSCPSRLADDFEQRFGCKVVQSWGMSEASSTLATMSLGASRELRRESVGCAVDGVELSVDEASGELLCRAPTLARGILDEDGLHELPVDAQGWFHTGDAGSIDEEGMVRICGRIKDIVVRGGMNIYPAEVERTYREHPDVIDCCLVGFPDEDLGERTCLCAVVRGPGGGSATASSRELRLWARGRIEKCRIPDVVLAMESLPLLANGKVDKRALRTFVKQWVDEESPQFKH